MDPSNSFMSVLLAARLSAYVVEYHGFFISYIMLVSQLADSGLDNHLFTFTAYAWIRLRYKITIKLSNGLACILACGVGYGMMLITFPETGILVSVSQ